MITEREIFDCLSSNFRLAAEDCLNLARLPAQGPTYVRLRERLHTIEGACRQMAHWREDAGGVGAPLGFAGTHGLEAVRMGEGDSAGWLEMAHMMGTMHKRIGDWLRGHYARELFLKAAEVLREMHRQVERRHNAATGHATMTRGAMMPPVRPGPHRDTRPIQVPRTTPGGLIIPPGVSVH